MMIHRSIDSILAICGAIVAVVGYKMINPIADRIGESNATPTTILRVGVVVCLIGCLWFAVGRVIGDGPKNRPSTPAARPKGVPRAKSLNFDEKVR